MCLDNLNLFDREVYGYGVVAARQVHPRLDTKVTDEVSGQEDSLLPCMANPQGCKEARPT